MKTFRYSILVAMLAGSWLVLATSSSVAEPRRLDEPAIGEDRVPEIELGEEYTEYSKDRVRRDHSSGDSDDLFYDAVMYLPNRVLDFLDIFRVDVGVGPAFGAVGRISKYFQFGYRSISPGSLRVGLQGRRSPIFLESSSEFGISPAFVSSHDRQVTPVEVGLGADLFLVGAYAGISIDELVDFAGGIVCLDFKDDDWK